MNKKIFRILTLVLCLSILTGIISGCSGNLTPPSGSTSSYDTNKISANFTGGNSGFAFDIFKQLIKEDSVQNVFISPLSISTALAMTYQGAGTTTKAAMAKALGYTGIDDPVLNESYKNLLRYLGQTDKSVELNISNSLWIRQGAEIKDAFISSNREVFSASVNSLDFSKAEAVSTINKWISDATKKKIDKMLDSPISPGVVMYLINAIYFKGDWAVKFDAKNTESATFYAGDGSLDSIMMMKRSGKAEYGQGEDYKAVRLPYGKSKMSMYCILPSENMLIDNFVSGLNNEKWKAIKDSISEREEVQLLLPRFKIDYGIKNLNESLTALGMGEAFLDTADFSGIQKGLYISRVLHKAVIEVNEEGSKAAAATVVEMKETAAAEPLIFNVNRPFVFVIADDVTGTILFIGRMLKAI